MTRITANQRSDRLDNAQGSDTTGTFMSSIHLPSILRRQPVDPVHARNTSFIAILVLLAGCTGMPAQDPASSAASPAASPATVASPSRADLGTKPAIPATPMPAASPPAQSRPDRTFTLPSEKRISLATYRAQMRARLMETEGASADVADCAAHASWVVPRSTSFDALKLPNGALRADRAEVKPWEGRFSPVKQAVPVSQIVMFDAEGHRRGTADTWVPIKVRCGYKDGMMLAYELLDADGVTITEAARPAPQATSRAAATRQKATGKKATAKPAAKAGAKSAKSGSKASAKPTAKKSAVSSKKNQSSSR